MAIEEKISRSQAKQSKAKWNFQNPKAKQSKAKLGFQNPEAKQSKAKLNFQNLEAKQSKAKLVRFPLKKQSKAKQRKQSKSKARFDPCHRAWVHRVQDSYYGHGRR